MHAPRSIAVRALLGIASWLPALGVLGVVWVLFGVPAGEWLGRTERRWYVDVIFIASGIACLIGLLVEVYFIVFVARSDATATQQHFWIYALIFFAPATMPVFWYRVIWKRLTVAAATEHA